MSGWQRASGYSPPRGAPPHGPATLTPAALLWAPPVAGGTLSALEAPGPPPAVALPTLGVALRALRGWSTGTWAATPTALEAEISFLWAQVWSPLWPVLRTLLPPFLQP